ncbi:hypothetical protein FACS189493_7990 [Spirochaetia bacterium]|nr:hypothetical protein FACS189493_7990 [Spirochaetia bacterium]
MVMLLVSFFRAFFCLAVGFFRFENSDCMNSRKDAIITLREQSGPVIVIYTIDRSKTKHSSRRAGKITEFGDLKTAICSAALAAGFVRARILAPFEPDSAGTLSALSENYRQGAPSLLVVALPYGNQGSVPGDSGAETADALFIAPFARRNYYREAVRRLQALAREFRARFGGEGQGFQQKRRFRILCNSPVPEKPLALASGLGALGRNGLIITPEAGSLVILAAMTLPFPLESDGPLGADTAQANVGGGNLTTAAEFPLCGGCDPERPPCAAACPTGAMGNNGVLKRERCIQWYASGKEEVVPALVAEKWGRRLYGCTNCQDACVRNRQPIPGAETSLGLLPPYLDGRELLSCTDEEITARFKGTALGLSWLGPGGIRRNIRTALRL